MTNVDIVFAILILVGGSVLSHIVNKFIDKHFFDEDKNNDER